MKKLIVTIAGKPIELKQFKFEMSEPIDTWRKFEGLAQNIVSGFAAATLPSWIIKAIQAKEAQNRFEYLRYAYGDKEYMFDFRHWERGWQNMKKLGRARLMRRKKQRVIK